MVIFSAGGKHQRPLGCGQAVEVEHQFVDLGFQARHVGAGGVGEDGLDALGVMGDFWVSVAGKMGSCSMYCFLNRNVSPLTDALIFRKKNSISAEFKIPRR